MTIERNFIPTIQWVAKFAYFNSEFSLARRLTMNITTSVFKYFATLTDVMVRITESYNVNPMEV
jgi:hypothetical protein